MIRIIGIILIMGLLASCSVQPKADSNFSIFGTIEDDYSGMVFLYKREAGEWIKIDSANVENNSFLFRGNIGLPQMYYIGFEEGSNLSEIFVEQTEIAFSSGISNFHDPEISGSVSHLQYASFQEQLWAFDEKLSEAWKNIKAAKDEGNETSEKQWEEIYDEVAEDQKQYIIEYAIKNNASVVSPYVVLRNAYLYDEKEIEPIVENFAESIRESIYVKKLSERVETLKRVAVGQPAVDFTMNDMNGNPVRLSSLYGGYLLVDFWASWCGPCRRENPSIVAAYQKFNNLGFDILGVSFDEDKEKWIKAVEDDGLTWNHAGDLKGWGNEAGKLYAVNSIPSNVLLDSNGVIIAKNLSGEDLHLQLEKLFSK